MYKLRELTKKDIPIINSWRNNEDLIQSLGAPFRFINQEVDEKWFDNYMQSRANTIRCAIISIDSEEIIGLVSLTQIDFIHRNAKLHIMIDKHHQNKGAGSFGVKSMIDHAFLNYGLHRIELDVLADNKRAQHVYEKCGFIKEGIKKQAAFKNGEYRDMYIYSLINE